MTVHARLMLPLDAKRGTWDRADLWELADGAVLAFVADAPEKASQHTGKWMQNWLRDRAGEFSGALASLSAEEMRLLLADLMTGLGDFLSEQGQGAAYAACSVVLVANGWLTVASVGDCAVYFQPATGPVRRFSDVTRAGGQTLLNGAASRVTSYAEGVYIGAQPRLIPPSDVVSLPVSGTVDLVLVSDGAEAQLGLDGLIQRLSRHRDPKSLIEPLRQELAAVPIVDDVTVLALQIQVRGAANPVGQLRTEVAERLDGVAHELGDLRQSVRVLESSAKTAAGAIVELKHGVKTLRERAQPEPVPAAPEPVVKGSPTPELRRIHDRLEALERGIGTLLEHQLEARKGRSSGMDRLSWVWVGIALVIFLQLGMLFAGWGGARSATSDSRPSARTEPEPAATSQDSSTETSSEEPAETSRPTAQDTAPAAASSAPKKFESRPCVQLAYIPAGALSAEGKSPSLTVAELDALLAQPKPPDSPFVVDLALARTRWESLSRWRTHTLQVQRDETWTSLAERFVLSPKQLQALNPKIRRGSKEIENPGDNLLPRDTVLVPALHYRIRIPDRGVTAEQLLQALGVSKSWLDRREAWTRRGADGRDALLAPMPQGPVDFPDPQSLLGDFEVPA